jgi:NAD(P)-dependent dehydrogenase (short-subunit alcohol dehydrogenase family)
MSGLLGGKVAIVTGGARGIGLAVATALAQAGARVVVNDYGVSVEGEAPSSAPAEEAAAALRAQGHEAIAHAGSVAVAEDARSLVEACVAKYQRVDILVNVAGIIIRHLLVDCPEEDWDRQVAVHLRGTFLCTKLAAPHMIRQRAGRIINFTSVSGLAALPGSNAYTAAKAGVVALTRMLAQELAPHGVTVNAIAPNATSRMADAPLVPDAVRELRKTLGITQAMGPKDKSFAPEYVGAGVAYLASDAAQYVNGEVIGIGGERIDLWSKPAIVASAFNAGGWTLEAFEKRFRATLGQGMPDAARRG